MAGPLEIHFTTSISKFLNADPIAGANKVVKEEPQRLDLSIGSDQHIIPVSQGSRRVETDD